MCVCSLSRRREETGAKVPSSNCVCVCVCVQIVEAREAANRLHLMISDNEQKQSSTLK